jgi:hypothetical protein
MPIARSNYGELRCRSVHGTRLQNRSCRARKTMTTFLDVTIPLDGPTQHTRSASRSTDPLSTNRAISDDHLSSSATICPTGSDERSLQVRSTIAPEPASPIVPHRSERISQPPERYSSSLFFTDAGELMTYREAMQATDAASWRLAMESEMNSIHANGTWDLVKLKALPCKWVYQLKQGPNSSSPKYKAHIIAKGF